MKDLLEERELFLKKESKNKKRTTWTPNDTLIYDNYVEIFLRNKKQELVGITKISLHCLTDSIKKLKWHKTNRGYCSSSSLGREVKMHRLVIHAEKGDIVDHINRDKLDNRVENLRIVSASDSLKNRERKGIVPIIVSENVE